MQVNQAFRDAAEGQSRGILAVSDLPLVSMDFRATDVSSTVDSSLTMVVGEDMLKVVAWYDNEWGEERNQHGAPLCCHLSATCLHPRLAGLPS